jgi:hypothetical protein
MYPDGDSRYKNMTFEPKISNKKIVVTDHCFKKYWSFERHTHHMGEEGGQRIE